MDCVLVFLKTYPQCTDSNIPQVGKLRCELSYRRCETPVEAMVTMINVEVEGVEEIQKELEVGAIDVNDIENRSVFWIISFVIKWANV